MRWLWRFLVYFIKPLAIWYIAGYFAFLSIRAVANAVASYERAVRKAEIAAEAKRSGASMDVIQCKTNRTAKAGRRSSKRKNGDRPDTEL